MLITQLLIFQHLATGRQFNDLSGVDCKRQCYTSTTFWSLLLYCTIVLQRFNRQFLNAQQFSGVSVESRVSGNVTIKFTFPNDVKSSIDYQRFGPHFLTIQSFNDGSNVGLGGFGNAKV